MKYWGGPWIFRFLVLSLCFFPSLLSASSSEFFSRVNREVDLSLRRREGVVIWWDRRTGEQTVFGEARLTGQNFRPGSVFKLWVAEGAIRLGMKPVFRCTGRARIAGERQFCWTRKGHGDLDLAKALGGSCNLFFAKLGSILGKAGWLDLAARYPGLFPPSVGQWGPKEWSRLAIGDHPDFRISPAQMAKFWEGFLVQLSEPAFAGIKEGLRRAVGEGTAARVRGSEWDVLGKTGTCDSESESFKTDAWFVGAYPGETPRYAMVIFLKEAYGFREASDLAGRIFRIAQEELENNH